MSDRLVREWINEFPAVKLNLFADTDGDWLVWAILRGYGTVLWRQDTHPGNRASAIAWALAELPTVNGLLPPHACLMSAAVSLPDLGQTLAKRAEESAAEAAKPQQKTVNRLQHTHAAHSTNHVQHTLDLAAH